MKDKITIDRIKLLHPELQTEVNKIYDEIVQSLGNFVTCRFAFTFRSKKQQDDLYAQGRTVLFNSKGRRLGIVTNAKGGESYHNYGLAIDIVLLQDRDKNGTHETASWCVKTDFDKDGVAD